MIRIALTGRIGSGKTFISKLFGYPVFNADKVVTKIYLKNKSVYLKLKNQFPNLISSFPIKRDEIIKTIMKNKSNLKKITSIIHPIVRENLDIFLKKNKKKDIVILDIPLYLENKINRKKDIIIFIYSNKIETVKRVKRRKNYNKFILKRFEKIQLSLSYKRKKSHFIIKNDFKKNSARKNVKNILKKIKQ